MKENEHDSKECCGEGCCETPHGQGRFGRFGLAGLLILVAGGLIFTGLVRLILRDQVQFDQRNSFTVTGRGKVLVKPDVAVLSLGVKTEQQKTAVEAVKLNTKKMNDIIAKLKALGVEEKDVKTTNYNLNPAYDYRVAGRGPTLLGYELSQNVDVKIRDLDKVGDIIKATTEAGANQIGNINFTVDNPDEVKAQARAEAIQKAREKAEAMAKAGKFKIGDIMSMYENEQPYPPIMYDKAYGIGGGAGMPAPAPSPEIQPGQNEITVDINITYQIKD